MAGTIKRTAAGLLAATLVLGMVSAGRASAAAEVAVSDLVRPAVVRLRAHFTGNLYVDGQNLNRWFNDGKPYEFSWSCSGFIVDPRGWVATAAHCVDDAVANLEDQRRSLIEVALQSARAKGYYANSTTESLVDWALESWTLGGSQASSRPQRTIVVGYGRSGPGLQDGTITAARVVEVTSFGEGDVALIKMEREGLPTLQLAEGAIEVGMPVVAVGFPGTTEQISDVSYDPVFQDGQIAGKRTQDYGSYSTYLVSAATSGGMSGGPAVDGQGRVIGLVSFGHRHEPEPFNFLATAEMLRELLVSRGVTGGPSPIDSAFRDGLQALADGDHDRAITLLEEVTMASPDHPTARDMLAKAVAAKASAPSRDLVVPAIGGAAGLLLIIGVVVGLRRRAARRRPQAPATDLAHGDIPPDVLAALEERAATDAMIRLDPVEIR